VEARPQEGLKERKKKKRMEEGRAGSGVPTWKWEIHSLRIRENGGLRMRLRLRGLDVGDWFWGEEAAPKG